MSRFSFRLLIALIILPLVVASCSLASPTKNPSAEGPSVIELTSIAIENTATPVPPTDAPSSTPTVVPVTETPSSTLTSVPPTETPTVFVGYPSQTPKVFTQSIEIFLPNLSGSFNVRAGTRVTLSDRGSDRKANTCTISKLGVVAVTSQIPVSGASTSFKLDSGTYILNCGQRSNATIYSE